MAGSESNFSTGEELVQLCKTRGSAFIALSLKVIEYVYFFKYS